MPDTAYAPPDPDHTPDAADRVAMLPDLHAALATFLGELPVLGPPAVDIPIRLTALERHPDVLPAADRDRLLAAEERLRPYLADPGDTRTVLHGYRSCRTRQVHTPLASGLQGRV